MQRFSEVHDDGRSAICRLFTKSNAVGKMADGENMLETRGLDVPTYAFLLLFHAAGHLGHRAVNGRIIWEIRQLLDHVYRHGLGGVQGARPERQLAHPGRAAGTRVLTTEAMAGRTVRPVGSGYGGASGSRNAVDLLARPRSGPWGRITRRVVRSAPHRSSAIALEHGHSVTKRDISLRKHVCVTRSLLKAIMADAQPFNTYCRRRSSSTGRRRGARESRRVAAARAALAYWLARARDARPAHIRPVSRAFKLGTQRAARARYTDRRIAL